MGKCFILDPESLAKAVEEALPRLAVSLRQDCLEAQDVAREAETHPKGRTVLEQLCLNARIASYDSVPLCQDTGYVSVLLEVSGDVLIPADIFSAVDAAVARAYTQYPLRKSLVRDALLDRSNSGDNTPAFCELSMNGATDSAPTAILHLMLKGGGSDNASRVFMLPPSAGIQGVREVVLAAIREKAANACPPLLVGVGVGSTFDKVAALAKRALFRPVGSINPKEGLRDLEQELLFDVNATGIGPGGMGGDTTALAVHIATAPCHIAALPVAVNLGCNAMRSISINLIGDQDRNGR